MTPVYQVTHAKLTLDEAVSFARHFSDLFEPYIVPHAYSYGNDGRTKYLYCVVKRLDNEGYDSSRRLTCTLGAMYTLEQVLDGEGVPRPGRPTSSRSSPSLPR